MQRSYNKYIKEILKSSEKGKNNRVVKKAIKATPLTAPQGTVIKTTFNLKSFFANILLLP